MSSDPLRPVEKLPAKKMFLIAAGLVIVCQLIAMVLVARDQVQKAQHRQTSRANFQTAVAACIENSYGAALKKCASLVNGEPVQPGTSKISVFGETGLPEAVFANVLNTN